MDRNESNFQQGGSQQQSGGMGGDESSGGGFGGMISGFTKGGQEGGQQGGSSGGSGEGFLQNAEESGKTMMLNQRECPLGSFPYPSEFRVDTLVRDLGVDEEASQLGIPQGADGTINKFVDSEAKKFM